MKKRKIGRVLFLCALALSLALAGCVRKKTVSTPGTGEEHTLPSAQAGYPSGFETQTAPPGYPQP